MRFIVSNKKYEKALEEIKKLKEAKDLKEIDLCVLDAKKCDLERKIDYKDTEIKYLNRRINKLENELIVKDEELLLLRNNIDTLECNANCYKHEIKTLENKIEELHKGLDGKNEIIEDKKDYINRLLIDIGYYKSKNNDLEKTINNIEKRYRDAEIEFLISVRERCKKARVKTKYRNKILDLVEEKLIKSGRN